MQIVGRRLSPKSTAGTQTIFVKPDQGSLNSLAAGTSFVEDIFSMTGEWGRGVGQGWFGDDSSTLHGLHTFISVITPAFTSDHQALDPVAWEPLLQATKANGPRGGHSL